MKNYHSLIFIFILIFIGCEQPRKRQTLTTDSYQGAFTTGNPSTGGSSGSGENGGGSDDGSGGSNIPNEFTCQNLGTTNYSKSSPHLNNYNICQSNVDPGHIAIQLEDDHNAQVCVFPTHASGYGSILVGTQAGCFYANAGEVNYIQLANNRPGYGNYPINSVMIIKDIQYGFPSPYNSVEYATTAYVECQQILEAYNEPSFCQTFIAVKTAPGFNYQHYEFTSF